MRRITMLLTAAAFMAVMMVASAAPAMANDLFDHDLDLDHFGGVLNDNDVLDNDLFDNDHRHLFDNDRRGDLFDDNGGFLGFGGIEQDSRSGNVGIGSDVS